MSLLENVQWDVGNFDRSQQYSVDNTETSKENFISTLENRPVNLTPYLDTNSVIFLYPKIRDTRTTEKFLEPITYSIDSFNNEAEIVGAIETYYSSNIIQNPIDVDLQNRLQTMVRDIGNYYIGGKIISGLNVIRTPEIRNLEELLPGVYMLILRYH